VSWRLSMQDFIDSGAHTITAKVYISDGNAITTPIEKTVVCG
jgi:hypothetical protein